MAGTEAAAVAMEKGEGRRWRRVRERQLLLNPSPISPFLYFLGGDFWDGGAHLPSSTDL